MILAKRQTDKPWYSGFDKYQVRTTIPRHNSNPWRSFMTLAAAKKFVEQNGGTVFQVNKGGGIQWVS